MMPTTSRRAIVAHTAATSPNARWRVRSGAIAAPVPSTVAAISAAVPRYRSETIFGFPPTRAISRRYQYVFPLTFFGYKLATH